MRGKGRRSIKSNVVAARLQGEKFDNGIEVCFLSIFQKKNIRFRPSHHVSISRLIHDSLALRHFSSLFPIHVDFFSETAAISIWRPRRSHTRPRNSTVAQRQWSNDDWGETCWMDRGDRKKSQILLRRRRSVFELTFEKKNQERKKNVKQSNSSSKPASILNTLSSSRAPVNNEATLSSSKKIKQFQTQAACIYEVRGD